MRSTAFGKIIVVYGHIDENGHSVRKWPSRKMPITDKMVKNSLLSVNLSEILAHLPEQEKIRTITVTDFKSLFSCGVRLHTFIIRLRPATRLMISSCRVATALALITRAPPYLPPC